MVSNYAWLLGAVAAIYPISSSRGTRLLFEGQLGARSDVLEFWSRSSLLAPSERSLHVGKQVVEQSGQYPCEKVLYVTDIEGDIDWFEGIVDVSEVFVRSKGELWLVPGSCFVFGGDVVDRFPGDLRTLDMLIALHARHPNQVFFIMGNRDINKLRLASELGDVCLGVPADECTNADFECNADCKEEAKTTTQSLAARVKWLFKYTLGGRRTFDNRKKELGMEGVKSSNHSEIKEDEDVARNFLAEVLPPNGRLFKYMKLAKLVHRIHDTVFVHASLQLPSLRNMPTLKMKYNKTVTPGIRASGSIPRFDAWARDLNEFAEAAVREYERQPQWREPLGHFGGEALVCYQSDSCMGGKEKSVVVAEWPEVQADGSLHVGDGVATFLRAAGVRRVCTGHKPAAVVPLITHSFENIELVMADSSYAGDSAIEVLIQYKGLPQQIHQGRPQQIHQGRPQRIHQGRPQRIQSVVRAHGTFKDRQSGETYQVDTFSDDSYIGQSSVVTGGTPPWWVLARLPGECSLPGDCSNREDGKHSYLMMQKHRREWKYVFGCLPEEVEEALVMDPTLVCNRPSRIHTPDPCHLNDDCD